MTSPDLTVHTMPIDDLIPYAHNAKIHTEDQINTIAESIKEFGNCDPIAIWHNEDGGAEIVEGHGRVLALKQLGISVAPVICLDHLTDNQRRAYTHIHNQTTLNSGFDFEVLDQELDTLDVDFEKFGFIASGDYSYLDTIIEEEFTEDNNTEADSFLVTLKFPSSEEDSVKTYIKEYGKDSLVNDIIRLATQW